ncbi:MAG: beta strand repeat-containing protein [Cyanobacteriota bacterium]
MASVTGTSGFDVITSIFTSIGVNGQPTSGDDFINAGAGDDFISGGSGNDVINGEAGIDTASYSDAISGVNVSLTTGLASGGAGFDTLISIENIIGSGFADTLTGSSGFNYLRGDAGNDIFIGSAGSDTLDGGTGTDDVANYSQIGTTVTLSAQGVLNKGPLLGTDTLIGIERIIGSNLLGDTVDLSGAIAPATTTSANLTTGVVSINGPSGVLVINGTPLSFTVSQFENVTGSSLADTITGNSSNNILLGGNGNDTFVGSAGSDILNGGTGTDDAANYSQIGSTVTLSAQGVLNKGPLLGTDTLIGIERIIGSSLLGDTVDLSGAIAPATTTSANLTTGVVSINGPSGVLLINGTPLSFNVSQFENVTGSNLADTITGNSSDNILLGGNGNDLLNGGAGNDTLNGGADIDTASYLDAIAAVNVSLTNGSASGGAGLDTLISIENLIGSGFADTLTGSSSANNLNGSDGNDSIFGELGNDLLIGGAGKDTLFGGGDADTFALTSLTDSLLANYDIIGDFTISDIIDRPGLLATSLNTSNGIASSLTASAVGSILNTFSFTANSSRAFITIGFSGTFVAFNDGTAGFNEFTDSIVYLPSFNLGGANSINIV